MPGGRGGEGGGLCWLWHEGGMYMLEDCSVEGTRNSNSDVMLSRCQVSLCFVFGDNPLFVRPGTSRGKSTSQEIIYVCGARLRPRHCSPRPSGRSNTTDPPPPLLRILGLVEKGWLPPHLGLRSAPTSDYGSPSQKKKCTLTRRLLCVTGRHQPFGSIARGCQGGEGSFSREPKLLQRWLGASVAAGELWPRSATGPVLTVGSSQPHMRCAILQNRRDASPRATTGKGSGPQTNRRGGMGGGLARSPPELSRERRR